MKYALLVLLFFCSILLQGQVAPAQQLNQIDQTIQQGDYPQALSLAQEFLAKVELTELPDTILVQIYTKAAEAALNISQFAQSQTYLKKAIAISKKFTGKHRSHHAMAINIYGATLRAFGNFEAALPYLKESLEIWEQTDGKLSENYAIGLNDLANLYKSLNQPNEAEPLYQECLEILGKILGKDHPYYASGLNNLALFYQGTGEVKKAIPLLEEVTKIDARTLGKSHPYYAYGLNNLALAYQKINHFDKAEPLFKESAEIQLRTTGEWSSAYGSVLYNLADLYLISQQEQRAYPLIKKTLRIWKKLYGEQSPLLAAGYEVQARYFEITNELDSAFHYCKLSLVVNAEDANSMNLDIHQLHKLNFFSTNRANTSMLTLIRILRKKSSVSENAYPLTNAFSTINSALEYCKKQRIGFSSDKNKAEVLNDSYQFAIYGVEVAHQLQQAAFINQAFHFVEQNRASLLSDALHGERARHFGDLPEALQQKEDSLQKEMDELLRIKETQRDANQKSELVQSFNQLNSEIEDFSATLKNRYPKYHQFKYQDLSVDAKAIQKQLDDQTLFIAYFLSTNHIYSFSISKNLIQLQELPILAEELDSLISQLRFSLSNFQFLEANEQVAFEQYERSARRAYQSLLAPILAKQTATFSNLKIVSDGPLGHIPFEAFLDTEAETNSQNYKQLPYLLHRFTISYAYSASLWLQKSVQPKLTNNGQILAMAASYENKGLNANKLRTGLDEQQAKMRSLLQDLPAAKKEIVHLSKYYNGAFYTDKSCNEKQFKMVAQDYAIVHLAMHGLLDENAPILSSLAFTENNDTTEDNFLEAWEIGQMNLNADLVVLSACETGYGRFQRGEGVMSLARSFMYAGVPALVVSLWQVNDQSTSLIMQNFYANLAEGMDKARALQQAKQTYITEVDNPIAAHPAFWAPFVQLGDSRPVKLGSKTSNSWIWWAIGVGGLLLLVLGLRVVGKKRSA